MELKLNSRLPAESSFLRGPNFLRDRVKSPSCNHSERSKIKHFLRMPSGHLWVDRYQTHSARRRYLCWLRKCCIPPRMKMVSDSPSRSSRTRLKRECVQSNLKFLHLVQPGAAESNDCCLNEVFYLHHHFSNWHQRIEQVFHFKLKKIFHIKKVKLSGEVCFRLVLSSVSIKTCHISGG